MSKETVVRSVPQAYARRSPCHIIPRLLLTARHVYATVALPFGSDIHVRLTLCRHSRQVVVTNEELHGPDMVGKLLGKGQRVADQS
jgi:hypothetical protein